MNSRICFVAFTMFAVAAALGAGFALLGPVQLIRIFGVVALLAGAAGCALQAYALREFAPRSHALLLRRLRAGRNRMRDALPAAQPAVGVSR